MESSFRARIEVDCKAHRVGISGPDGTLLEGSMSPTPSGPARSARPSGEGVVARGAYRM